MYNAVLLFSPFSLFAKGTATHFGAAEKNLDVMMAKRKISSNELAAAIGITPANLSVLKTGKAKAIRFSTLEKICEVLQCQPGDILCYKGGGEDE